MMNSFRFQGNPRWKKGLFLGGLSGLFVLLCVWILWGGSSDEEPTEPSTPLPNLSIPQPQASVLSANRVEALQKQKAALQAQNRLERAQANSFDWYSTLESDSPSLTQLEDPPLENPPLEDPPLKAEPAVPVKEVTEQEHQAYLAAKRKRLEQALGVPSASAPPPVKATVAVKAPTPKPKVEKCSPSATAGFYGLAEAPSVSETDIRAVVHGRHENLRRGSLVKFRLLDDLRIDGTLIPANTFFYGEVSFANGRAHIHCESIQYRQRVYPFSGTVFDKDGFEGLYVPNNHWDEAKRQAGAEILSSTSLTLPSTSLMGAAANAFTSALQTVAQHSVREQKLTISSNYQVIIQLKP